MDHQLGWVGLPTFLAPLSALNPPKTNISPSNKLKMYVISLYSTASWRKSLGFFFNMKKIESKHLYHRSSSFDFHSRLSSYASYTEIGVCFLFKVSRDCFRTPTSHTMLLPCVENVGILQLFSIISRSLKYLLFSNQNFTSKVFLSFFRPHKSSH